MQRQPNLPEGLTQSVFGALREQYGDKAEEEWARITEQDIREEKERKIRSLQQDFPGVRRELVEQALIDTNWNVDDAVVTLFQAIEKEREEADRRKREAEREARKREATERANAFLRHLFAQVPHEKIQAMLEANEGDVDATTDQLLAYVKEQEEAKAKEEASRRQRDEELRRREVERERELKFQALKQKFEEYISEEQIAECLQKNNWEVKTVSDQLLEIVEARKFEKLQRIYSTIPEEEIRVILNTVNWDMVEAIKQLRDLQAEKRKPKLENSGEPKLEKSAEAEPKLKSTEPKLEKSAESKLEKSMDPKHDRTPIPQDSSALPFERDVGQISRKTEAFMMRSAILEKELNELIEAQRTETEEERDDVLFKKVLEEKLRFTPEDVPGLPGMIPLTPHLIDRLQGRKPFESQLMDKVPHVAEESVGEKLPEDAQDGSGEVLIPVDTKVILKASPLRLDLGKQIVVSWESEEATTTYDYICLYRSDSNIDNYITYKWIGKAERTGSLTFTPPDFGEYVFRYFSKNKNNLLATSEKVQVGPQYRMEAVRLGDSKKVAVKIIQETGNVYPNAWVGMYPAGQQDNRMYYTYEWLASAVDNTLTFEMPKIGEWEFRVFPLRNYVDVGRTVLKMEGRDELHMVLDGATLKIQCNIQTVDPACDSVWIGLFQAQEANPREYKKYKYVATSMCEITFRTPSHPGTYDARLFANKKLDVVARSNTVAVPAPSSA